MAPVNMMGPKAYNALKEFTSLGELLRDAGNDRVQIVMFSFRECTFKQIMSDALNSFVGSMRPSPMRPRQDMARR